MGVLTMRVIASLLAVFAFVTVLPANLAQAADKRVLIIGIDGVRPDALASAATPSLDRLVAEGAYAEPTLILGERYRENNTVSGPSWSSILTGVWADKHGTHDNTFEGKNYEEYPHFFTRVKEAHPDAQTVSMVSWAPIDEHIVSDADIRHVESLPPGDDRMQREEQMDKAMAAAAAQVLNEEDPVAMFVYFHQPDAAGHGIGFSPEVPEYINAIENVDARVGEVLAALRNRPDHVNEDWLIIVCTDHGGLGTRHGSGHDDPEIYEVFLIISGPSAQRGSIEAQTYLVDVAVTALAHLGIEADPAWDLDGNPVGLR